MEVTKDMALLYGIIAGDGCLSRSCGNYFISITCNFYDDIPFFDEVVQPLLEKITGKKINYRLRKNHGKIEFNFTNKTLFEFFENLKFPVGKKGTRLLIPDQLEKYKSELISGYFATDGSLVLTNNNGTMYPRLEIQSISQKILVQVLEHLESFGLRGAVYNVPIPQNMNRQSTYRLQLNGIGNLLTFEEKIGFLNPKHRTKMRNYIKSRGSSVVERHKAKLIDVQSTSVC